MKYVTAPLENRLRNGFAILILAEALIILVIVLLKVLW